MQIFIKKLSSVDEKGLYFRNAEKRGWSVKPRKTTN